MYLVLADSYIQDPRNVTFNQADDNIFPLEPFNNVR